MPSSAAVEDVVVVLHVDRHCRRSASPAAGSRSVLDELGVGDREVQDHVAVLLRLRLLPPPSPARSRAQRSARSSCRSGRGGRSSSTGGGSSTIILCTSPSRCRRRVDLSRRQ
eukprot:1152988-Heterocapsa_arctica.AAC.1